MRKIFSIVSSSGIGALLGTICFISNGLTLEDFCDAIEDKDDSVLKILNVADKFGFHDSLLALKVVVSFSGLEDVSKWLSDKMKGLSEIDFVNELYKKYVAQKADKAKMLLKTGKINGAASYNDLLYHSCLYQPATIISGFVWENYSRTYLDSIHSMSDKLVGVWQAGVYCAYSDENYIDDLEKKVFPYLIMKMKSFKADLEDEGESSVIKYVIFKYIFNVFDLGFSRIGEVIDNLVKVDVEKVADADCREFYLLCKELLKNDTNFNLYLSEHFIYSMMEIVSLFEYYEPYKSSVKSTIPLMLLFIGSNDLSYYRLINEVKSPLTKLKWKKEYMAALYRCLLVTSDENKRQRLINIFDEAYDNEGTIIEYGNCLEAITEFYQSWAQRLKAEFEKKYSGVEGKLVFLDDKDIFIDKWIINGEINNKFKHLSRLISGIWLNT